jgi:hypothetical protein
LSGVQLLALFAKEPPRQRVELLAQNRVLAAGLFQGLPQGGRLLFQQVDLSLQRRVVHPSVNQTCAPSKMFKLFCAFMKICFYDLR